MAEEFDEDLLLVAGLDRQQAGRKRQKRGPSPTADASESDSAGYTQGETATPAGQKHTANRSSKVGVGSSKYPDGYDSDLMGDEEDRARMAQMSELEREMELFERGDKRKELLESQAAARKMQESQAVQDKAAAMRSSTRTKTVTASAKGKHEALAELTAARTAKEKRTQQQLAQDASSDEESLSEESYDRKSSDESARSQSAAPMDVLDDATGGPARRAELQGHAARDDEDDIELKDAQRIQLSRNQLAKWLSEPFFAETVPGCLVKIGSSKGYWVASVADVEHREPGPCKYGVFIARLGPENRVLRIPYVIDSNAKVEKRTHIVLLAERGSQTTIVPISMVSNKGLDQEDFDDWARYCRKDGTQITSLSEAEDAAARIQRAQSYVYTAEDIQRMVEGRRTKGRAANQATHKARLQRQLEHAIDTENVELRVRMEAELAEVEDEAQEREDRPAEGPNKKDMSRINKANARRNFQNALNNVSARPGGRAAQGGDDAFARRSTRPMNYWATSQAKKASELHVSTNAGADEDDDVEPETPGTATAATVMQQADGSLNFKLDLSRIPILTADQELARNLLGKNWQPKAGLVNLEGKHILTLSDYRRKQGI